MPRLLSKIRRRGLKPIAGIDRSLLSLLPINLFTFLDLNKYTELGLDKDRPKSHTTFRRIKNEYELACGLNLPSVVPDNCE
jgi:hypothetical protein